MLQSVLSKEQIVRDGFKVAKPDCQTLFASKETNLVCVLKTMYRIFPYFIAKRAELVQTIVDYRPINKSSNARKFASKALKSNTNVRESCHLEKNLLARLL